MDRPRHGALAELDRRQDRRMRSPRLVVTVNEAQYRTLDWSFGGFRIAGYSGSLKIGERFLAHLAWGDQPLAYVLARVVRRDRRTGELAAAYTGVSEDGWRALERAAAWNLRRQPGTARR